MCRLVILQPMPGQPKLWTLPKATAKMAGRGLKDVQAPALAAFLAPAGHGGPGAQAAGKGAGGGWVFTWDPWVSRTGQLQQPGGGSSTKGESSSKKQQAGSARGDQSRQRGSLGADAVDSAHHAGGGSAAEPELQACDAATVEKRLRAVRKKIRQAEELAEGQGAHGGSGTANAEQREKLARLPALRQESEDLAALLAALSTDES